MSNWSIKQRLREDILEAVEKGDVSKVEELLDRGADVNESEGGYIAKKTLLLVAIENKNEQMARLLIDRGADLSLTVTVTGRKKTLVELAGDKELQSLSEYIQYMNDVNDRFVSSIREGNVPAVQEGINRGANVRMWYTPPEINQPDCTLLQLALLQGHMDVAKLLITAGVDLQAVMKWEDQTEDTAKSYAERMNYDVIVSLIEEHSKEQRDKNENTNLANGNTAHDHQQSETQNKKNTVEIYDIEDFDDVKEESTAPLGAKQQKKNGNCTIS